MADILGRLGRSLSYRFRKTVNLTFAAAQLIAYWPKLRRCRAIGIGFKPAAFSTGILGADSLRRLYPNDQTAFIIVMRHNGYNPLSARMFTDMTIVYQREFPFARNTFQFDDPRHQLTRWLLKTIIAPKAILLEAKEVYRSLPTPPRVVKMLLERDRHEYGSEQSSMPWVVGHSILMRDVPKPPLKLPAPLLNQARKAVLGAFGLSPSNPLRFCCLYTRREEGVFSDVRNGSPLESWVPAIRRILDAGYRVLLLGDREVPANFPELFGDRVLSELDVPLDKHLYRLFVASEADMLVGDSGGGIWISAINGIPALIVNSLPYCGPLGGNTVSQKFVRDAEGRLAPLAWLYGEMFSARRFDGYRVEPHSAEELDAAVESFLEEVRNGTRKPIPEDVLAQIPESARYILEWSRLSPAWTDAYRREGLLEPTAPRQDDQCR